MKQTVELMIAAFQKNDCAETPPVGCRALSTRKMRSRHRRGVEIKTKQGSHLPTEVPRCTGPPSTNGEIGWIKDGLAHCGRRVRAMTINEVLDAGVPSLDKPRSIDRGWAGEAARGVGTKEVVLPIRQLNNGPSKVGQRAVTDDKRMPSTERVNPEGAKTLPVLRQRKPAWDRGVQDIEPLTTVTERRREELKGGGKPARYNVRSIYGTHGVAERAKLEGVAERRCLWEAKATLGGWPVKPLLRHGAAKRTRVRNLLLKQEGFTKALDLGRDIRRYTGNRRRVPEQREDDSTKNGCTTKKGASTIPPQLTAKNHGVEDPGKPGAGR